MSKNCLVAQSGGPTPIINASLQGVIETAKSSNEIDKVYGARFGINGLMDELICDLTAEAEQEIKLLKHTPGSILGSCRYKLNKLDIDKTDYEKIFKIFKKYDINYFFYIGGNDSMDTVAKLNQYAQFKDIDLTVMGIPKTIDNDLLITDHSPGFGSAAKYIATSVMETTLDSRVYQRKNVHLIEVMGRHAGWLAAASALAGETGLQTPDLIYFPEITFSTDKFVQDLQEKAKTKDNIIVVVSEGIKDESGNYISAGESSKHDQFGHKQMGGAARSLVPYIKEYVYERVKVIEFNVLQRAANHVASKVDAEEAYACGSQAVEFAVKENATGKAVVIKRVSNDPYKSKIELADVDKIANQEKKFPREWINKEGNHVTEEALEYLRPLAQGEMARKTVNGLPRYSNIYAAVTTKPKAEL
ncbi:MAG TPA: 6-phosphofructokinase [Halanaerobiales bacterium]|nr:6-phosphofructokinase [Halanaerobiales bacterium]